jgi:hypothetical protein
MDTSDKEVAAEGKADLSPAIVGKTSYAEAVGAQLPEATVERITRVSGTLTVLVAGIALFSDGYNAQIIGYMEPLFSDLYVLFSQPSSRNIKIILAQISKWHL